MRFYAPNKEYYQFLESLTYVSTRNPQDKERILSSYLETSQRISILFWLWRTFETEDYRTGAKDVLNGRLRFGEIYRRTQFFPVE